MHKNISVKIIENGAISEQIESFERDFEINLCLFDKNGTKVACVRFIALLDELEDLARGFLHIKGLGDCEIKINEREIIAKINAQDCEILAHLAQKDIIQTCESIITSDIKHESAKLIIPFNGTKCKIHAHEIAQHTEFFAQENANFGAIFRTKIIAQNGIQNGIFESCDTNPKNAIYKAFGKALKVRKNIVQSVLLIDSNLNLDLLKIILCYKVTFVIFSDKPSFHVLQIAQKFGLTLIAFFGGRFEVLTHQMRVVGN